MSDTEKNREALLQRKASTGYRNVDAVLESILYAGERKPRVALLFAETSIADPEFKAGVQAARDAIDFDMTGVSFTRTSDFIHKLQQLDGSSCDVLCIVRADGDGIDDFDDPELAETVMKMKMPTISAIGGREDNPLVCRIADKNIETPALLGRYFKDMVERIGKERADMKASLTKKVEGEFKEQMETLQAQQKGMQEQSKELKERLDKIEAEATQLKEQNKGLKSKLRKARLTNVLLWVGVVLLAALLIYTFFFVKK